MKQKKIFGIVLLIITIFVLNTSTLSVLADDDDVSVTLVIDDAYYCDADSDGVEDDVVIHFTLDIDVEDWQDIKFYRIIARLSLPSGYMYRYYYYLSSRPSDQSTLFMYNHATESGWYTIELGCTVISDEGTARSTDSLIFDPPEGIGGTEPPITRMCI